MEKDIRFSDSGKRYVDVSNLHKRGKLIDWKNSIGCIIPFKSDKTVGEFIVDSYSKPNVVLSLNGKVLNPIKTYSLLSASINTIVDGSYSKSINTEEVIHRINKKNPNIEVVGEYINSQDYILCRCKKCMHTWNVKPNHILSGGHGCPSCSGHVVCNYDYHNSIYYTRPDLRNYFVNESDMLNLKEYSNKKVKLICPNCKTKREMKVDKLSHYGFNCSKCSDGISYPEKFGMSIINQLKDIYNIHSIKREFKDTWTENRRYDIKFEFNGEKYLIEFDGGWHYIDNEMSGISAEDSKEIDANKDLIALKNGYTVIRINCYYPRVEDRHKFIKNNVLNSEISNIFDLSIIDWDKVEQESVTSRQLIVWNLKKSNPDITVKEINEITKISKTSIRRYLQNGSDLGFFEYKEGRTGKGLVYIFKNGNLMFNNGMSGKSISENSLEIFGVYISKPTINERLKKVGVGVVSETYTPKGSNDKYSFIRIPNGSRIEEFYKPKAS